MSAANENHEPVQMDDLHDRLVDTALAELASQRVPPDLSGRITAAHEATLTTRPEALANSSRSRRIKWFAVAVAASLLIGVGVLLSGPESNPVRQTVVALTSTTTDKEKAQQTKIAAGIDEFNRLKDAHRYAEAEIVARRLNELAPDDPVVNQTWLMAKFLRREMKNGHLADDKESATWAQLSAVEKSEITPLTDKNLKLVYERLPTTTTVTTGTLASDPMAKGGAAKPGLQPAAPASGPTPVALDFAFPVQAPSAEAATNSSQSPNFITDLDAGLKQDQGGKLAGLSKDSRGLSESKDRYGSLAPATTAPTNSTPSGGTAVGGQTLPSPHYLTDDVQYYAQGSEFKLAREAAALSNAPTDALALRSKRHENLNQLKQITPGINIQEEDEERLGLYKEALVTEGQGPGASGDKYTPINENPFIKTVGPDAVSTFSIDVDTASYSNVRQFLTQMNQLPPPDAVRIEELVNYFQYDYTGPENSAAKPPAEPGAAKDATTTADTANTPTAPGSAGGSDEPVPFAAHVEVASCPWNAEHRLARIAVKGRELDRTKRPQSNLVFLVDVSGSMNEPAKLPLVVFGLEQLTKELGENDHIAIVVYASSEGLVLPSTSGTKQDTILAALGKLQAGGSTAGGAGINLAYQIAEDNFIKGGTNRVILCTDGDFNVGVTSTGDLQTLVEKKAKDTGVFLSVLGFGRGNLNDAMMEAISGHGNGNYHYVDNRKESRRVLVEEMTGTLVTIAKDVKIQVEFNPTQVAGYRLIGYEDRMLRTEDFNDDKKDAGEIGAGHTVTAMYELIPAGKKVDIAPVDDLKYQKKELAETTTRPVRDEEKELLTLKMRYKAPDGDTSKKLEWPITDAGKAFGEATDDFQFASAVAGFGLLLRNSQYKGNLTFAADLELAQSGIGADKGGYRAEFVELVQKAKTLKGE